MATSEYKFIYGKTTDNTVFTETEKTNVLAAVLNSGTEVSLSATDTDEFQKACVEACGDGKTATIYRITPRMCTFKLNVSRNDNVLSGSVETLSLTENAISENGNTVSITDNENVSNILNSAAKNLSVSLVDGVTETWNSSSDGTSTTAVKISGEFGDDKRTVTAEKSVKLISTAMGNYKVFQFATGYHPKSDVFTTRAYNAANGCSGYFYNGKKYIAETKVTIINPADTESILNASGTIAKSYSIPDDYLLCSSAIYEADSVYNDKTITYDSLKTGNYYLFKKSASSSVDDVSYTYELCNDASVVSPKALEENKIYIGIKYSYGNDSYQTADCTTITAESSITSESVIYTKKTANSHQVIDSVPCYSDDDNNYYYQVSRSETNGGLSASNFTFDTATGTYSSKDNYILDDSSITYTRSAVID